MVIKHFTKTEEKQEDLHYKAFKITKNLKKG